MLNNKKILGALLGIVILGTFLRFYRLGEMSFVADEFLDMSASYGYFQTGEWQAWDFNLGQSAGRINQASDERAWLYRWQVAGLFHFFAPTETTARAVSAVWGVLSILMMYGVATSFTRKKEIGLLSAGLFAISISAIVMDRHLRMYAMFYPVFLVLSWALFWLLEGQYAGKAVIVHRIKEKLGINMLYIIPVLILGILSYHLHQLTANLVFIILGYLLFMGGMNWKKNRINHYVTYIWIVLDSFLMLYWIIPEKVVLALGMLVFFENHWSYLQIIFQDYSSPIVAMLFLFAGIAHLWKVEKIAKETAWLNISFWVPLLAAIFLWRRVVGEQYIFFIQSFQMIILASGIYGIAVFLRDNVVEKYRQRIFLITIVISLMILPNYGYFFQENNTYQQTSRSENPNYRSIFTYFKKNKKADDVLITRDFRNYYWSGQKVQTFDFGGELSTEKFNLADLQKIMAENPSGWFIFSDNDKDYISQDAQEYVEDNLEKINAVAVRGGVSVYRWGK